MSIEDLQESISLTYGEIGRILCTCVDTGIITKELAGRLGNQFFPILDQGK